MTLSDESVGAGLELFNRGHFFDAHEVLEDVWRALPPRKFPNYASGSWGPAESDQLMASDEREWRRIEP